MATPCYAKVIYGPTVDAEVIDTDENVELPLTTKNRLLTRVVYGDDENQVLYLEHTLFVEAVIYLETLTSTSTDVEEEVSRIRGILTKPAQQLRIYPVGLGEFGDINVSVPDLKGGPYPQDVEVMPLATNKAILVRWSVMFRTKDCSSFSALNLLQYNIEQDMEVDDDGNIQFTVHITLQTKNPITDVQPYQDATNLLIRRVGKSFQGMRKKKRTSFSRDQRIMSIRLVYTDIHHDNALYPYTSDINIVDDLESTLLSTGGLTATKNFYTWKRSIGGTIKLPARVHKGYAWLIFLKILASRFANLRLNLKLPAVLDVSKPDEQTTDEEVQRTNWFIPLKIKITEPIYSREIRVNVEYLVCTSLDSLFDSTKMFERVNTLFDGAEEASDPLTLSEQWEAWHNSRDHNTAGTFRYTVGNTPIVYNQCDGTVNDAELGANRLLSHEEDPYITEESSIGESPNAEGWKYADGEGTPPAEYSWIKYENEFEFIENSNSMPVVYLEQPAADYYTQSNAQGANNTRATSGMVLNGKTSSDSQGYPANSIDRASSQHIIKMTGHALRLNHKIPIPFIVSVGGKTVKRLRSRSKQKQIASGDQPVYLAMWEVDYMVLGGDFYSSDVLSDIVTTGAPGYFT